MSTGQSYLGKGDSTTQPNENSSYTEQTAYSASNLLSSQDHPPIQVASQLADVMHDPQAITRLRRDMRAWFTAYAPQQQQPDSANSPNESQDSFQKLDDLLGQLVLAGVDNQVNATTTTATPQRSSIRTFFTLEVCTQGGVHSPSEYDTLLDALCASRDAVIKEMEEELACYAEGRANDPVDLYGALEYGPLASWIKKLKQLNNWIDLMACEISATLFQHQKEVDRA